MSSSRNGQTHSEAGKLGYKKSKEALLKRYTEFRKAYDNNPKRCRGCNNPIPYEKRLNKFCNQSCAASFNNLGIRRHGKQPEEHNCINCGTLTHNPKFCSCSCQGSYRHQVLKSQILSSGSADGFGSYVIKKVLKDVRGTECSICHNKTWNKQEIPLVLDHIDGHSENNSFDNLRLVCGNCDMLLPTYKGKNKGNGRHSRRQRYKEGKSY